METICKLYASHFGEEPKEITLLPLSGSARRYWRVEGSRGSVIACEGTSHAENKAFITIARTMRSQGINAPEIYAVSDDGMCYLQEDLGDGQLYELLQNTGGNTEAASVESATVASETEKAPSEARKTSDDPSGPGNNSETGSGRLSAVASETGPGPKTKASKRDGQMQLLRKTVAALPKLQLRTGKVLDWGVCFPDREMNRRMVRFDLNYFKYDFLKLTTLPFDELRLQDDFDRLEEDSLLPFGNSFMYRDFKARNIMIRDGEPWFIDFQGGRRGPGQYDLASFLWNSETSFDARTRRELESVYIDALREELNCSAAYSLDTPAAVLRADSAGKPGSPYPSPRLGKSATDLRNAAATFDEAQWRESYRTLTLLRLLQEAGAYGYRGFVERKAMFLDSIPALIGRFRELCSESDGRYPYLTALLLSLSSDWDGSTLLPDLKIEL